MTAIAGHRRTRRAVLIALAVLPLLTFGLLVRPAAGQAAVFGLYSLTGTGGAVTLGGEVGAGGGLAVIDGGIPSVSARLDSSPSASVRASAWEPGTLFRTVAGVVNTEAGAEVISVVSADASYPGTSQDADGDLVGTQEFGPLTLSELTAHGEARADRMLGSASAARHTLDDGGALAAALTTALAPVRAAHPDVLAPAAQGGAGLVGRAGTDDDADAQLIEVVNVGTEVVGTADPVAGALSVRSITSVGSLTVAGEIVLAGVQGVAEAAIADGQRTADGTFTVASITVAGVPVGVDQDGLTLAGEPAGGGDELREVVAAIDGALAEVGIRLEAVAPMEESGDGFAEARSGGIRISIATAPNEAIPGNDLVVTVGNATVTLADRPPFEAPTLPPAPADVTAGSSSPSVPPTVSVPTGPTVAVEPPPAEVAAPTPDGPATSVVALPEPRLVVAGHSLPAKAVLAVFGGWQLLSLSVSTVSAVTLRGKASA